ncbi:hypothetical protein TGAM01_v204612 [Trichoderma gamsii]|uniref:Uncharacterized protein n=1 Tax=Trichoderma gamsii TaxID=398673 RepID=A0A2P4ZQR4_9HYPO|nr:hypothetical protein TGAM01_v204612 [Trichoderma gamsii]PON26602.1 hypothetical protein TGAM01_v204612 [Trichoderma gamsii]
MQSAFLLLWAATLSSAKLFVNYDEKLEGRPKVYTVVKEEIGRLDVPSKSSHKNNDSKVPLGIDLKPREALDILLGKRQTCAQGYGYCPTFAALTDIAILRDPRAVRLAHVAKAKPAAASPTACPPGINAAKTNLITYYWTVTWYYWYYYWTYSIDIQASVVTSTRSTTQTVFSVKTTDAGAASEYFSEKSRTLSLPTPAAATTLESLAGSTSFVSTPSSKAPIPSPSLNTEPSSEPSITEKPSAPFDPIPSSGGPDDNESSSSSESRSSSTTTLLRSGGDDGGTPPKNGGSGSSGAKPLWAGSDWKSLWVLALGVGTGVLAAVL